MEDTNLGVEEVERQQEVGIEDIRRLLREAYEQGFMDAVAWMQKTEGEMQ
jgi:hypothetical protein